jgi:hypothetical protein
VGKPFLGGLGRGDGSVALVLTALIVAVVGYLTITRKDVSQNLVITHNYVPPLGNGWWAA